MHSKATVNTGLTVEAATLKGNSGSEILQFVLGVEFMTTDKTLLLSASPMLSFAVIQYG